MEKHIDKRSGGRLLCLAENRQIGHLRQRFIRLCRTGQKPDDKTKEKHENIQKGGQYLKAEFHNVPDWLLKQKAQHDQHKSGTDQKQIIAAHADREHGEAVMAPAH